jgi:hypothetical protein
MNKKTEENPLISLNILSNSLSIKEILRKPLHTAKNLNPKAKIVKD